MLAPRVPKRLDGPIPQSAGQLVIGQRSRTREGLSDSLPSGHGYRVMHGMRVSLPCGTRTMPVNTSASFARSTSCSGSGDAAMRTRGGKSRSLLVGFSHSSLACRVSGDDGARCWFRTFRCSRPTSGSSAHRTTRNGAGDRNRTGDPVITSDVLYQLSYTSPALLRARSGVAGEPPLMGWCDPPESNWGHRDFQSRALPTELGSHEA